MTVNVSNIIQQNKDQDFFIVQEPYSNWPTTNDNKCRLLILDSSFNPPTRAHLNLLEKAIKAYPTDFFHATLLLFASNNVDKPLQGASIVQRIEMMQLVSDTLEAAVGLIQHGRFVDKAASIHSWLSKKTPSVVPELYFILGYDTVVRLLDPKYYQTSVKEALAPFFHNSVLICADRSPSDEQVWEKIQKEYGDSIRRIELDPTVAGLSSTKAREALKTMDRHKLLSILPIPVVHYILEQNHCVYNK